MDEEIPPVTIEQVRHALATAVLEQQELLYERTHNPIHVWQAFAITRRLGVSAPSWVLDYFGRAAAALTEPAGARSPQQIATALEFARKGGPSHARRTKIQERNQEIVDRIGALKRYAAADPNRDLDLQDTTGIVTRIAEEYELSFDRVQRIYYDALRSATVPSATRIRVNQPRGGTPRSPKSSSVSKLSNSRRRRKR